MATLVDPPSSDGVKPRKAEASSKDRGCESGHRYILPAGRTAVRVPDIPQATDCRICAWPTYSGRASGGEQTTGEASHGRGHARRSGAPNVTPDRRDRFERCVLLVRRCSRCSEMRVIADLRAKPQEPSGFVRGTYQTISVSGKWSLPTALAKPTPEMPRQPGRAGGVKVGLSPERNRPAIDCPGAPARCRC